MESFDRIVRFLADQIKRGKLFIMLTPPFDVSLEPMDVGTIQAAGKELEVEEGTFSEALHTIESMLLALLQGELQDYIASRVTHDVKAGHIRSDEEAKRKDELQEQAALVERALIDERLRQRYQLKVTSKAPFFTAIDWDVKLKTADASGRAVRFPYATCRIKFQKEFEWAPYLLLGGRPFDAVQVNLCREDIQYLQRVLQTAFDHLVALEREYEIP